MAAYRADEKTAQRTSLFVPDPFPTSVEGESGVIVVLVRVIWAEDSGLVVPCDVKCQRALAVVAVVLVVSCFSDGFSHGEG